MAHAFSWMTEWWPRSSSLGLSIGTSSIKCVALQKMKHTWKMTQFHFSPLPTSTIVEAEMRQPQAVVDALKKIKKATNLPKPSLGTSLGGPSLVVKTLKLNTLPQKDSLLEEVLWEAEQWIPFDLKDMNLSIYPFREKPGSSEREVVVVAIKKKAVDQLTDCLDSAGFFPQVIDIDFFAMQHIFEANYDFPSTQALALLDLGASSLKLMISYQGVPLLTKEFFSGGTALTEAIQKKWNLSFEEAEALKLSLSESTTQPQEILPLLSAQLQLWSEELKKTLSYYQASAIGPALGGLFLMGGGCRLPSLCETFEKAFHLPTTLLNPFRRLEYDLKQFSPAAIQSIHSLIAVPLGMAIRCGKKHDRN